MTLQEQIEEAQEIIDKIASLRLNPGYILMHDIVQKQEILRRNAILKDSFEGLDGVIKRSNLISELQGMGLVLRMPDLLVEEAQTTIIACQEQLRLEEEANKNG